LSHSTYRKSSTVWRTLRQSRSLFGSNTAHCIALSIECSSKMNMRRPLTYFHSGPTTSWAPPQPVAAALQDAREMSLWNTERAAQNVSLKGRDHPSRTALLAHA
jgi:hypothetical protein